MACPVSDRLYDDRRLDEKRAGHLLLALCDGSQKQASKLRWMQQVAENLTSETGFLSDSKYLLLDRDTKFCRSFREILSMAGVACVKLPKRSPNLNGFVDRFMRSIKSECLRKLIFFGNGSLQNAVFEYLEHYHLERNHQGLDNQLIKPRDGIVQGSGELQCRERLGGMLRYYYRNAA